MRTALALSLDLDRIAAQHIAFPPLLVAKKRKG
jgi:hypothetical protein